MCSTFFSLPFYSWLNLNFKFFFILHFFFFFIFCVRERDKRSWQNSFFPILDLFFSADVGKSLNWKYQQWKVSFFHSFIHFLVLNILIYIAIHLEWWQNNSDEMMKKFFSFSSNISCCWHFSPFILFIFPLVYIFFHHFSFFFY